MWCDKLFSWALRTWKIGLEDMEKKAFSRAWFRSTDLWVMGPARFHCATLLASWILPGTMERCLPNWLMQWQSCDWNNSQYLQQAIQAIKMHLLRRMPPFMHLFMHCAWACGAMDNASDYGSEDSRFESWQARSPILRVQKSLQRKVWDKSDKPSTSTRHSVKDKGVLQNFINLLQHDCLKYYSLCRKDTMFSFQWDGVNSRIVKSLQHPVFPGGHPSKY